MADYREVLKQLEEERDSLNQAIEAIEGISKNPGLSSSLQVLAVNLDDPPDDADLRSFAANAKLTFPLLKGTSEVAGVYDVLFRYLFDRHRDLGVPTSFLIDSEGMIVKVYQGVVAAESFLHDAQRIPRTSSERQSVALPFPGVARPT